MTIRSCKNCSKKFKWWTLYKAYWSLNPMECPHCKAKHKIKSSSTILICFLISLPLFIQKYLFERYSTDSVVMYLVWVFMVLQIGPFLARYRLVRKDEE